MEWLDKNLDKNINEAWKAFLNAVMKENNLDNLLVHSEAKVYEDYKSQVYKEFSKKKMERNNKSNIDSVVMFFKN